MASSTSSSTSTSSASSTIITAAASIALLNRGPILDVFSAPTSCLSTLTVVANGLYFGHNGGDYEDPACYPSATSICKIRDLLAADSPAVACPSGWYKAQTATSTFGGYSDAYLTIGSDTTAVLCCPSGYTALYFNHGCRSDFLQGTTIVTYKSPTSIINGNWDNTNSATTTTHIEAGASAWTVFGDGIPIWYQATDQLAITSGPTTSSSPTISHTTSSIPATTSPTSPISTSTGLSTGSKAGIGISVAVGVTALAALTGFFMFKRRKRYKAAPTTELVPELQSGHKTELPGQDERGIQEMYSDNGNVDAVSHRRSELA
ncbi:uncharacterized protein PAC_13516 [Phialocephala subalpina]|uniref:Uncharacterized protein n=1 Tax=Phialocephala subalpina TaxID=576137 RepID=A0A1L7XEZ4_9HELO|nr:uncharacterized protein PAC_13516 [Phialocephala subalpina]